MSFFKIKVEIQYIMSLFDFAMQYTNILILIPLCSKIK